jgi:glycine cleavage system H protein
MAYPVGYRYTKAHEWVAVEGNRARIGITDHAQSELGDIVFVELPAVGSSVQAGQILATVESSPEAINRSPHDEGWIAVIEIADLAAVDALLDATGYESFLAEG